MATVRLPTRTVDTNKAATGITAKQAFSRGSIGVNADAAQRIENGAAAIAHERGRPDAGNSTSAAPIVVSQTVDGKYEIGRTYQIERKRLTPNPVGPRVTYAESNVEDMRMKLSSDGQREAIKAYVRSLDGAIVIVDGGTRWHAAPRVPLDKLYVLIEEEPGDDRALYEKAYSANHDRNDHTPLDDATRWSEFLERGLYADQSEIAARLHRSQAEVSRTLQLAKIPAKLRVVATEFPNLRSLKTLNAIREFYQALEGDEDQDMKTHELILDAGQKEWGYRDIEARRAALGKTVTRTRSEKLPFTFDGVRGELRAFPGKGRVDLSIKGLTEGKTLELQKKLHEWLAQDTDE